MTALCTSSTAASQDHVILLHEDGTPRGLADRATVHSEDTPLHLAFSCHLLREDGAVLMTRRAVTKRTWPGVWTNSFCGHPRQGETMPEAIARHARHELGIDVHSVREALPDFRYRAVDASGVVENEICPVFIAETDQDPRPNPAEVEELRWVDPDELQQLVGQSPWTLSPWSVTQLPQLRDKLRQSSGAGS